MFQNTEEQFLCHREKEFDFEPPKDQLGEEDRKGARGE
jgi:hypothetical protein